MLPTPDTSHVPYERVYEPAEDSFLLLDTLSSESEVSYLKSKYRDAAPLIVEVGTGSGVVLAFVNAHARSLFGTSAVMTAGVDMNLFACRATVETVARAQRDQEQDQEHAAAAAACGTHLGSVIGDLTRALRVQTIDVLIFNPPYVPTEEMPQRPTHFTGPNTKGEGEEDEKKKAHEDPSSMQPSFENDSYLLALSYAGGKDGMETTERLLASLPDVLSPRGCAYVLLCARNKPDGVIRRIRGLGPGWCAETVRSSGKQAGREKLQVLRIWKSGS